MKFFESGDETEIDDVTPLVPPRATRPEEWSGMTEKKIKEIVSVPGNR